MAEKRDSMLLMDRRFLMDFLSEENEAADCCVPAGKIADCISGEEIAGYAKIFHQRSPRTGQKFSRASRQVSAEISKAEFCAWAEAGIRLMRSETAHRQVVDCFLESSPAVMGPGSSPYVKGWAETGERILEYCGHSAEAFFRFSPAFMGNCDAHHIRKWAEWGIEILHRTAGSDHLAALYFERSVDHLKSMSFRELKEWKNLGVSFLRASPDLGGKYFAGAADGLACLNWPERNILYRLTSSMLTVDGKRALAFFNRAPRRLKRASPNTRDAILEIVEKLSRSEPLRIPSDFDAFMAVQSDLPYPTCEMILRQAGRIIQASVDAARAFIRHVPRLVHQIPESFIGRFVDYGLLRFSPDDPDILPYFSLSSEEAAGQIRKWKNAVSLEDHSGVLAMFAEAMTGHVLGVKKADCSNPCFTGGEGLYPATDGKTIFLPPVAAGGLTVEENFGFYKAATAHQAGYLEFGSFQDGLNFMRNILEGFPQKELALDIFLILEDGRIDWMLTNRYRGLATNIQQAVSKELDGRRAADELPLWQALVEILLRISVGRLDDHSAAAMPDFLLPHIDFLKNALDGFYTADTTLRHCFSKTVELYSYITRLPGTMEDRCQEGGPASGAGTPHRSYRKIPPLAFRGTVDLPQEEEPVILDVEKMERGEEKGGTPLTPEELRQLIDGLADPLAVLKVAKGRRSSSPGIFIRDTDKLQLENASFDEDSVHAPPENRFTASGSVSGAWDGPFFYDEWDYQQGAYRKNWCCLSEKTVAGITSPRMEEIYRNHAGLIWQVRRQFAQIRPHVHEIVPRVEWGDEIDLPAAVQVMVDKKSGTQPSEKIFNRKEKKIRNIAVLFLIDMSASTGNLVVSQATGGEGGPSDGHHQTNGVKSDKKIIDIEIESLVVIMEALEALKDEYAIYGFSGFGRNQVDFYRIKTFDDGYTDELKRRIAGIAPKQSTRMGPAIRHAAEKLAPLDVQQRLLILLSDGFPQDSDYGEDRTSHTYGLHDTMMALLEARNQGIQPFCITVDQEGSDYLKKMCDPKNYLVIQDIFSLPEVLPKVVESLIEG